MDDQSAYAVMATLAVGLAVTYVVLLAARGLGRSRPGFSVGWAVAAALIVRGFASGAVSLTPVAQTVRGGDELYFLSQAEAIGASPWTSPAWIDALTSALYNWVFAAQISVLGDAPELALRCTQIGIAVGGLLLLAAAVYELAGPRASVVAMWLMALEPTSIFFSSLLHKEPLMLLAEGSVAFGGALLWRRGGADLRGLLPIAAGSAIAVATRPYAGWFLIAAGAAIALHAALRNTHVRPLHAAALLSIVGVVAALSLPTVLNATSEQELAKLQSSQTANATDDSNLQLEFVDYSTREDVVRNLPSRVGDVLLKPYPWQIDNVSQRLGLLGTTVVLIGLAMLVVEVMRHRGSLMDRAGPLIYVASLLLVAYSLSAGNAGTAFRYRTHLVVVALCFLVVLWSVRNRPARHGLQTS